MLFRRRSLDLAALTVALALPFLACNSNGGSAGGPGGSSAGGSGGGAVDGSGGGAVDGGSAGDAGKSYPLTFVCEQDAGADCPSGQACPEVPLSSTSCGDLPAALGHPAILQTTGRPAGCIAWLPYGNPYYLDSQVECLCMAAFFASPDAGLVAAWACAL